ncbi:hypothetical protein C1I63_13840 [Rathayibacter caricis DSM 15933]|uniref:Uncharacterized protein n=1 Tax=Rathayibacter caricis DSM 15933 TaxID=1328867 RepID=A0A2T4UWA4_9MICO|nr:hypothetical protein [Rathayibacter caricis]PTL73811.1 hypothetical protein C1I63_13840 [Rathayibacter caricis DSM 15933]
MTPTQHRTAAEKLFTQIDALNHTHPDDSTYEIATAHAILANTAGTGDDYDKAGELIEQAEQIAARITTSAIRFAKQAQVRAHLATR